MSLASLSSSVEKARQTAGRSKTAKYPAGVQMALEAIAASDEADGLEEALVTAIRTRIERMDKARKDLKFRGEEWERCRKDPAYFVSNWVWTYDPRRSPSTIPFTLFAAQEDYLRWLQDRIRQKECGLFEKSRDVGATWLNVAFAAWQFIFVSGSKVTFGSRKEILVDRIGDPDSIFEKIRQLMESLPIWMKPKNYSDGFLKFANKDNGSTITGEAGDQMGRGGRSRIYFLDEFAFVNRANKVDAAVSNNADVRIYCSTPNGDGNPFAKKRFSGKIKVFRLHWKADPRKNLWILRNDEGKLIQTGHGENAPMGAIYPWYEKQRETLDPIILAQEIDIDYSASKEGIVIPNAWIQAAINLSLTATGDRVAGLDIADEGANLNVLIIRKGNVIRLADVEAWHGGNTTQTAYKAKNICEHKRVKRLNYDSCGVGAGVGGTLESSEDLQFQLQPVNGGASTTETFYKSFNRDAKDVFRNLRAEMWWNLRVRFEKTYEHVNRIHEHPLADLISIPNCAELISQLSQPLYKFNDSGQIVIEKKEDMKKRGVDSPDYADALVYAFAPGEGVQDFDWMKNA